MVGAPVFFTDDGGTGERGGGGGSGGREWRRGRLQTSLDAIWRLGRRQASKWRGGRGMPGTQLPGCLRKTTGGSEWAGPDGPSPGATGKGFSAFFSYFSFLFLLTFV